nr:hypothetical protein [Rhizobiaceae bacterium]
RIKRVARRAAFNRFVYHLGFPMAQARDLAFKLRKPEAFLADLDWLYAYKPTPLPPHPLV